MKNSNQSPIRVVIADDHPLVRDGLRMFLANTPDMVCVGEAENGEKAVSLCWKEQPDVALIDLVMPVLDGPTAIAQIRKRTPQVRCIALTSFGDTELVKRALQAGASGYLLKQIHASELAAAIRAAASGQRTYAPEIDGVLGDIFSGGSRRTGTELTEREIEVLTLLAKGMSDIEIARALHVARPTVRFHLTNIFARLGVTNRTEAVRYALDQKLVK